MSMDLKERVSRAAVLRQKYETICARMKTEEGEEERSQAYFVIKAAQRKEELQREGDELVRAAIPHTPRHTHHHRPVFLSCRRCVGLSFLRLFGGLCLGLFAPVCLA